METERGSCRPRLRPRGGRTPRPQGWQRERGPVCVASDAGSRAVRRSPCLRRSVTVAQANRHGAWFRIQTPGPRAWVLAHGSALRKHVSGQQLRGRWPGSLRVNPDPEGEPGHATSLPSGVPAAECSRSYFIERKDAYWSLQMIKKKKETCAAGSIRECEGRVSCGRAVGEALLPGRLSVPAGERSASHLLSLFITFCAFNVLMSTQQRIQPSGVGSVFT